MIGVWKEQRGAAKRGWKLTSGPIAGVTEGSWFCETARAGVGVWDCGAFGFGVQHAVVQFEQQHLAGLELPQAEGSAVVTLCATTSSTLKTMAKAVRTAELYAR